MTRKWFHIGVIGVVLIASGCSSGSVSFAESLKACGLDGMDTATFNSGTLDDGTKAEVVDLYVAGGDRQNGLTLDQAKCFMQGIGVPDDVQTRVLISGPDTPDRQESWGGYGLTYSRPSNGGLDLSVYSPPTLRDQP